MLKTKVTTEIIEASESEPDENSVNQKGLDKPFKTENDPVSLAYCSSAHLITFMSFVSIDVLMHVTCSYALLCSRKIKKRT